MDEIDLTIVIPMKNEENNVLLLYQKINEVLLLINFNYEIIIIDDGSTDSTYEKITQLKKLDHRIKIIKFRKNLGKSTALNFAFQCAKGEIIVTMDGDLQDDPEEIPKFITKIEEGLIWYRVGNIHDSIQLPKQYLQNYLII